MNKSRNLKFSSKKFAPYKVHWSTELAKIQEPTILSDLQSFENERSWETQSYLIPASTTDLVEKLVKKNDLGVFITYLTAINVLLSKYIRSSTISLYTPLYNNEPIEDLLCQEVLVVNEIESNDSFKELLGKVKNGLIGGYKHQNYPLDLLDENTTAYSNILVSSNALHPEISKSEWIDFHVEIIKTEAAYELKLHYLEERISPLITTKFGPYLNTVLQALKSPNTSLNSINFLTETDRKLVLDTFNNTKTVYPSDASVPELFAETALEYPSKTAVSFDSQTLSYQKLDTRSNILAQLLLKTGVKEKDYVLVLLERGTDLATSLLGILKAGAIYVPVDPNYPDSRINYIIEDSNASVVVCDPKNKHRVSELCRTISTDELDLIEANSPLSQAPTLSLNGDSPAYCIYTSGSTGTPKGVVVNHRSIVRLIRNTNYIEIKPEDNVMQSGSFAFDASTFEIWGALLNGGTLFIVSQELLLNNEDLQTYIFDKKINIAWFTASFFNQLIDSNITLFDPLKHVLAGGEKLSSFHVNKLRLYNSKIKITNGYGPTENTTFSTFYPIEEEIKGLIPIGKPIANSVVYIVDQNNQLLPPGMPGEMLLGGDGVAMEYLNNPKLTQEKFILLPSISPSILYRSGDVGRWLSNGNIEIFGRTDEQVKIRGFRIELGEIENVLSTYSDINNVAVTVQTDEAGEKILLAYYVANTSISNEDLRAYMDERVPHFMIPQSFISLDQIPLTTNGKLDRKALPKPVIELEDDVNYVAPETELEATIAEIWSEVLEYKGYLSVKDNFFTLGGHSLKAVKLVASIKSKLNIKLTIREIFNHTTVRALAGLIESKGNSSSILNQDGPMKLVLTMNLPYTRAHGGANKSNKSLAEEFVRKGHEVIVITPALAVPSDITHPELLAQLETQGIQVHSDGNLDKYTIDGVQVHAVVDPSELRNYLIASIQNLRPDWILMSAEDPSQTLLRAAHEVAPDRIIYLAHTPSMLPFGPESHYPGAKRTELIQQSAAIVTISKFVGEYIEKWGEVETLYNHPPHFGQVEHPNLGSTEDGHILMINPSEVKGISVLVELARVKSNWSFAVIPSWGTTPSQMKELESLPNMHFIQPTSDLNSIFKQTRALLMPSLWQEGFGMACVDAMLRGIPVISSNQGGLPEAKLGTDFIIPVEGIEQYTDELDENSFAKAVLPPQDLTPWLNALETLFENDETYQKHSDQAQKVSREFVKNLTIDPLEQLLVKKRTERTTLAEQSLELRPIAIQEHYAISSAQRRLWILDQINDGYYGYIISDEALLGKSVDVNILKQVFDTIVDRHESLRTTFKVINGEPRQQIHPQINFRFDEVNLSQNKSTESELQQIRNYHSYELFDLASGPLLRGTLVELADKQHKIFLSMHHIVSDGLSMEVLIREIEILYKAYSENEPAKLDPLPIQYKDFSAWQNLQLDHVNSESQHYWRTKLSGDLPVLNLPVDFQRPPMKTYDGRSVDVRFLKSQLDGINSLAKENDTTLFVLCTAIVKTLLHRYSGQNDIIIGAPSAGRTHEALQNQIGFYVNMLALRDDIQASDTFSEVVKKVKQTNLDAISHEAYPYDKLIDDLDTHRDLSRSPLFDVMITVQDHRNHTKNNSNETASKSNPAQELRIQSNQSKTGSSHDIAFMFFAFDQRLSLNITYNTSLFLNEKIERMGGHVAQLMDGIISDPSQHISTYDLITDNETAKLITKFNQVNIGFPKDQLLHSFFETQANLRPESTALIFENEHISYKTLNEKSNQLAHLLRAKGTKSNNLIAIMLDRSPEMLIGILAILKSGAGYVPIDPTYPKDRINFTLKDCGSDIVLTHSDFDELVEVDLLVLNLDKSCNYSDTLTNPEQINTASDTAYVIYTSGSTGKPKGVLISHSNVVRLFFTETPLFDFNHEDVWTMFHSFCFDFSVWEMYGALLFGGKLVIVPKLIAQSTVEFANLVSTQGVTILNQTPSAFYNFSAEALGNQLDLKLRNIIFGGEALNPIKLRDWKTAYPKTKLINMYGITETTVHVTYKEITAHEISKNVSNIGKPIPTLNTFILDANQRLLPVGVAGELCIIGDGLAKGYLNRPELTAEKFIDAPHSPGAKMYRSGDLARFLENGELEYLGRIDHQVKIRGFRIELGEIESRLIQHPSIEETLVISRKDGNDENYLCAYCIAPLDTDTGKIRAFVNEMLPSYMIPAHFIWLSAFPITKNGKIDRKALPEPQSEKHREVQDAPNTPTEKAITRFVEEVLGGITVGINDNFFEIGGHSLKANQLLGKIYKELKVTIRLGEFFDAPYVKDLAHLVDQKESGEFDSIHPVAKQDEYELSNAQRRLWILNQLQNVGTAYNMPFAFRFSGTLNVPALESALKELIKRHESLRTTFGIKDGIPNQKIHPFSLQHFQIEPCAEEDLPNEIKQNANHVFDLEKGPLFVYKLLRFSQDSHALLINMHHIIGDGVSLEVLFKEFQLLYTGFKTGVSSTLPPLSIQYKDYAAWLNSKIDDNSDSSDRSYWHSKLDGDLPILDLITDAPRPPIQTFNGEYISSTIKQKTADALIQLSQEHDTSLFVLLHTAVKILLQRYTGQEDLIVGTPVSGRIHPDLENQIGFYVNTLALRDEVRSTDQFTEVLEKVKHTSIKSFEHQSYPFDLLVNELNLGRDLDRNPLFDVFLILNESQNQPKTGDGKSEHKSDALAIGMLNDDKIIAKFDLSITFNRHNERITSGIVYNTDLFKSATIERLLGYLNRVLDQIVDGTNPKVKDFSLLGKEDHDLFNEINNNQLEIPSEIGLHQLFKQQATNNPDKVAIVHLENQITYSELEQSSNQIANQILENGCKPGDTIGILQHRGIEPLQSILGILKAGCNYLPMDLAHPQDRIQYYLEDSGATMLIVSDSVVTNFSELNDLQLTIRTATELCTGDIALSRTFSDPEAAAYILYTSGSTGQPKGVSIKHSALLNTIYAQKNAFKSNQEDINAQFASLAFDVSGAEIFGSLLMGATLVVCSSEIIKDTKRFEQYLTEQQVTCLQVAPAYLALLDEHNLPTLKKIISAGEEAKPQDAVRFGKYVDFYNAYGPTEASIYTTSTLVDKSPGKNIPIGKPIANTEVYIVDKHLQIQPIGIPGELCVAGNGVAKEYLNRPELSAEKFIKNPFSKYPVLYKTGDLARILPNGQVEYLGRNDEQVKLRGFRIELGEIEYKLKQLAVIDQAVVLTRALNEGEKEIIAYIVYKTDSEISPNELKLALRKVLPDYMVPSYFVPLKSIPKSISGKVNRKALLEIDIASNNEKTIFTPYSDTSEQLVAIWKEILGFETLYEDANFFEIGGHSLRAAILLNRIRENFKSDINLSTIFGNPTIQALSNIIENAGTITSKIDPAPERSYYPLSSAQKRIFILNEFEGIGTAYNMPGGVRIDGPLNYTNLESAFQTVFNRHESLRTSFELVDGEPHQRIHQIQFKLDLVECAEDQVHTLVEKLVTPFDLAKAPLLNVKLLKISEEQHVLAYDMHHIVGDGFSLEIWVDEVLKLYAGATLPPLKLQYKDYAWWQNGLDVELKKQEVYWKNQFQGEIPTLNLITDFPRPVSQDFSGAYHHILLNKATKEALNSLSKRHDSTMFMTIFALFNVLLSKVTNQNDLIVGTPVAGRNRPEIEGVMGMFVNNIAIRNQIQEKQPFTAFLQSVKEQVIHGLDNQDYQFENLIEELELPRNFARNPLFDVSFTLQTTGKVRNKTGAKDFKVSSFGTKLTTSKFDLTLGAKEFEDGISLGFEYATSLFKPSTIKRLGSFFEYMIQQVIENESILIDSLELADQNELRSLVKSEFPSSDAAETLTLVDLITKQVGIDPSKTALIYNERALTYLELDQLADIVAWKIHQHKDINPGDVIGLLLPKGIESIICMLGVLKAGNTFLPMDVNVPAERIQYYLADSQTKALITSDLLQITLEHEIDTFFIESLLDTEEVTSFNSQKLSPEGFAYLIYTSGSTGKPKGVKVKHKAISNTLKSLAEITETTSKDRPFHFASLSFDASVMEIFISLISGATLIIIDQKAITAPEDFEAYLTKHKATIGILPPTYLALLNENNLPTLRSIITGGEAARPIDVKRFQSHIPYFNAYGPTEGAICTNMYKIEANTEIGQSIPIGKSIANMESYILDVNLRILPPGVPGELCIAGIGVAKEYLNRPELSEEKFISNPFSDSPYPILYKTGDLAYYLEDGTIQFVGRNDDQVKIRGYRIELGEVQHQLVLQQDIEDAAVVVSQDGSNEKRLIAFVVTSPESFVENEFKDGLRKFMPAYMVPSSILPVDEIPLTVAGKIDQRKLLEIESAISSSASLDLPDTNVRELLYADWKDILGHQNFGIYDNFFDIGGNSLLAVKLVARLAKNFDMRVNQLFENPTIASLSEVAKYEKGYLENRLQALKGLADTGMNRRPVSGATLRFLRPNLRSSVDDFQSKKSTLAEKKEYQNILLTGGLGFLGMHLFLELLCKTESNVYLLLRSSNTQNIQERLQSKLDFYFPNENLLVHYASRIHLIEGDLAEPKLGFTTEDYAFLSANIDGILHSAAKTTHYGNWEEFEQINISGTEALLQLAETGSKKDVHYISTLSVASGTIEGERKVFFDEQSGLFNRKKSDNYYIESKNQAEEIIIAAREKGINTSIYRVGNLAFNSTNGIFQENIEDNAFINSLKMYFILGEIPAFIPKIYDFSFINKTAEAICTLMECPGLFNTAHHISNPQ